MERSVNSQMRFICSRCTYMNIYIHPRWLYMHICICINPRFIYFYLCMYLSTQHYFRTPQHPLSRIYAQSRPGASWHRVGTLWRLHSVWSIQKQGAGGADLTACPFPHSCHVIAEYIKTLEQGRLRAYQCSAISAGEDPPLSFLQELAILSLASRSGQSEDSRRWLAKQRRDDTDEQTGGGAATEGLGVAWVEPGEGGGRV